VSEAKEISPTDLFRRQKAIQTVLRGVKYIMGYLPDYPFEVLPEMSGNPIEVHLKIWIGEKDYEEKKMPPWLKMQLERIEKQISDLGKGERNP